MDEHLEYLQQRNLELQDQVDALTTALKMSMMEGCTHRLIAPPTKYLTPDVFATKIDIKPLKNCGPGMEGGVLFELVDDPTFLSKEYLESGEGTERARMDGYQGVTEVVVKIYNYRKWGNKYFYVRHALSDWALVEAGKERVFKVAFTNIGRMMADEVIKKEKEWQ